LLGRPGELGSGMIKGDARKTWRTRLRNDQGGFDQ
jgi:hypothetical protein